MVHGSISYPETLVLNVYQNTIHVLDWTVCMNGLNIFEHQKSLTNVAMKFGKWKWKIWAEVCPQWYLNSYWLRVTLKNACRMGESAWDVRYFAFLLLLFYSLVIHKMNIYAVGKVAGHGMFWLFRYMQYPLVSCYYHVYTLEHPQFYTLCIVGLRKTSLNAIS